MSYERKLAISPGDVFGALTAVHRDDEYEGHHTKWICKCECGTTKSVFSTSLRTGESKSCGCLAYVNRKEQWDARPDEYKNQWKSRCNNRTHGLTNHPIYRAWGDMKARCTNTAHKWYPSYGGRGIHVAPEWNDFDAFVADMMPTWKRGLQLGRIDNDAGYSVANCRWETPMQNQNNKSNNRFVDTPKGEMTIAEASREFGISYGCLLHRMNVGTQASNLFKPSIRSNHA